MLGPFIHDGLRYYTFAILADHPELRHGVFTRRGGASFAPKNELNLAFGPDDRPENVAANLEKAEAALGLPKAAFVRQTHSANVLFVNPEDGYQPRRPEETLADYDALAASRPGVSLLIKLADCQGVLLYAPRTGVVALVHSGWRGSAQNILGRTVAALRETLGVEPGSLLAAISPSLGPCCAEFKNYREELPESFRPYRNGGDHFDFWAISRDQLTAAGVRPHNIETAGRCTKCDGEFFSYRGGDRTGRFGVMAGLAPRNF